MKLRVGDVVQCGCQPGIEQTVLKVTTKEWGGTIVETNRSRGPVGDHFQIVRREPSKLVSDLGGADEFVRAWHDPEAFQTMADALLERGLVVPPPLVEGCDLPLLHARDVGYLLLERAVRRRLLEELAPEDELFLPGGYPDGQFGRRHPDSSRAPYSWQGRRGVDLPNVPRVLRMPVAITRTFVRPLVPLAAYRIRARQGTYWDHIRLQAQDLGDGPPPYSVSSRAIPFTAAPWFIALDEFWPTQNRSTLFSPIGDGNVVCVETIVRAASARDARKMVADALFIEAVVESARLSGKEAEKRAAVRVKQAKARRLRESV